MGAVWCSSWWACGARGRARGPTILTTSRFTLLATNPIGLGFVAVLALGAHCQHSPWAYAPEPAPAPRSQVFFDSGAVVRAYLQDGNVVTGRLLVSFAPGGQQLVACQARRAPCGHVDAPGARRLPLTAIQQLEFPYRGTGIGADLGFRSGRLVALSHDHEDVGPSPSCAAPTGRTTPTSGKRGSSIARHTE